MRYRVTLMGQIEPECPRLEELAAELVGDFGRLGVVCTSFTCEGSQVTVSIELDATDATAAFLGGRGTMVDILARRGVRTEDVSLTDATGQRLAISFPHWHVESLPELEEGSSADAELHPVDTAR